MAQPLTQTIQIIGGRYRGKKISFPPLEGLRPTPSRVRETLFNWLMHDIRGARCLDAFAGSGVLGIEAFSRGAQEVTLIEQAPEAYQYLKKMSLAFNTPQIKIVQADACLYLRTTQKTFDIVFFDPPFHHPHLLACIETLRYSTILKADGLLYLETPQELSLDPSLWKKLKLKQAGQVTYGLYQKISLRP